MGINLSSIDQADYVYGDGLEALQVNADYTLGPLFYGWAANIFLCGVVLAWAGTYVSRGAGDRPVVKLTVFCAVLFEVATSIANLMSIIQHGKDQDRTNNAISLLIGPDSVGPMLGAIPALATQSFFATRCYQLLPRWAQKPFAAFILAVMLASLAGAVSTTAIEIFNHGSTDVTRGATANAYEQLEISAMLWLWGGVIVDVVISALLMIRLYQNKAKVDESDAGGEGEGRMGAFFFSFMRLSFEVAVLTAVTALISAGLYMTTTETTNLSYAFSNMLPGLYALSLLWALNSSHRLAQEVGQEARGPQHAIQLVWNLAAEGRDERLLELARGGSNAPGRVKLERGTSPPKASKRFGQEVQMLTVRRGSAGEIKSVLESDAYTSDDERGDV